MQTGFRCALDAQCRMGVEVYICDPEQVAQHHLNKGRYYVVETQKRIGWKLSVEAGWQDNRDYGDS